MHENTTLETQFKQRAYDGRWERMIKVMDYDEKYTYQTESGSRVTLIPEKWITVGVYDCLMEFTN